MCLRWLKECQNCFLPISGKQSLKFMWIPRVYFVIERLNLVVPQFLIPRKRKRLCFGHFHRIVVYNHQHYLVCCNFRYGDAFSGYCVFVFTSLCYCHLEFLQTIWLIMSYSNRKKNMDSDVVAVGLILVKLLGPVWSDNEISLKCIYFHILLHHFGLICY